MSGKNTSLWTCSGVAAYYVKSTVMYILCAVFLTDIFNSCDLARPKYKLPDDGHKPKHVGAF